MISFRVTPEEYELIRSLFKTPTALRDVIFEILQYKEKPDEDRPNN